MKLFFLFVALVFASVVLVMSGSARTEGVLLVAVLVFGIAATSVFGSVEIRKGTSKQRAFIYVIAGLAATCGLAYLAAFLALVWNFHT